MAAENTPSVDSVKPVTFSEALKFWLKLGFISFGGPAGQISIMHQELVERKAWISDKRFLHALNYCMVLPGPEAQQLATYIGWLLHKTPGALAAGLLFILPSFFIIVALAYVYLRFGDLPIIAGIFYGIKPAVAAIVWQASYRIGSRSIQNKFHAIITALALAATFFMQVPFPLIVLIAGIVGYFGGRYWPHLFTETKAHKNGKQLQRPALIDDNTPLPDHVNFNINRLLKVVASGVFLWSLPMGLLILKFGWQHTFTQMSWFFTKAAFLTIGGAYAVLPYVYQGAVVSFAWLSPTQMIDGLALGESTPGPLIMIVTFVGFTGAYLKAVLGTQALFLSGLTAAALVTWFTFLPSFIFILAGGPFIESTRKNLKFTAPLTLITVSIVGVILNLALFISYHVFWPKGFSGSMEWMALVIFAASAIALFKYKISILQVLGACALLGLLWQFSVLELY